MAAEQPGELKLKNSYGMLEIATYLFILLDVYVNTLSYGFNGNSIARKLNGILYRFPLLTNIYLSHLALLAWLAGMGLAAGAKKDLQFDLKKHVWTPAYIGLICYIASIILIKLTSGMGIMQAFAYGLPYLIGAIFLHTVFQNLTKILHRKPKEDVWNVEEESFEQNRLLNPSPDILALPMQFYYKKKVNDGWININPFRGLMVLGVPGSGKSESVIVPAIKQMLAKGYSMLVYDFKYPTLAEIVWYHYKLHHRKGGALEHHAFHCINLDRIEYSRRINPLLPEYVDTLAKAGETADAIVSALQKGQKSGGGADQFFTQSAINFLSASIYFLAHRNDGKFSSLPHLLAFLAQPYDAIFTHLFTMVEIQSLLAPFASAYNNKAFDQLEGQIGTLRVNISRLATPETFWVFGGSDFDLKISGKNNKSILVLANSIEGQNINSAFFASVLNRTISLINSKGNNPCAIIVDECPTVFLYKVENLIATARSNKVAVILGLQEMTQFYQQYGKETANTIASIMGSVLSGAVKSKETLDWLEKMFGKIKQENIGLSINKSDTSLSLNERLDSVIPASKIANQNVGEMVGVVARGNDAEFGKYETNTFKCKIKINMDEVEAEMAKYTDLPKFYDFGTKEEKKNFLLKNMEKIYKDIQTNFPPPPPEEKGKKGKNE